MSQGFEHFSDVFFLRVALKIDSGWIAGHHLMEAIFQIFVLGKKNSNQMYGEFGGMSSNNQFLKGCPRLNSDFLPKDLESSS